MAIESPSGNAEIKVAAAFYGGWKVVRVSRSIEQIAGTFELEVSERWPGQPAAARPIRPGAACQVLLDGTPIITGHVDAVDPDFDANRHGIRVAGRDKTADLVDCSAIYRTGQWRNVRLDRLAADLLKDYAIKVVVEAEVGAAFSSWNIQEGETVFECLDRAARMRALLLTSNPAGDLVIARAGQRRLAHGLVEGINIKAARGNFTWQDRFSRYVVKGQGRLGEDGDTVHSAPSGTVSDATVSRHRPLVVLAESHSQNATLRDRAEWERNVRRGRSARASITVQGWRDPSGALWEPNTLVPVTSPRLWLNNAWLLIVGCIYSLDDQGGTLTELAVGQPEAFQLLDGVKQSKLFGKLRTKEQREKRATVEDWSEL